MQIKTNRAQLYAPYDWHRQVRETQSISYDPDRGAWDVFRYADVVRVLNDYTTFSSDENRFGQDERRTSNPISSTILNMDPPRHRQLR
ncbi:MAG TPA: cytochrome P450, partial [Ktedonobacteraceae bacterium]|nr:cytochrome P450 [Ktedonobacteraceae bacterium]